MEKKYGETRKKSSARKVDTARLAASRNVCHPTQDIKQGPKSESIDLFIYFPTWNFFCTLKLQVCRLFVNSNVRYMSSVFVASTITALVNDL